jgi:AmiR/NasT family two-component response regulator
VDEDELFKALTDNRLVNTAIGMLMERRATDQAGAWRLLSDASRRTRRRVADVAGDYIAGVIDV